MEYLPSGGMLSHPMGMLSQLLYSEQKIPLDGDSLG